jgi:hypothetical protein
MGTGFPFVMYRVNGPESEGYVSLNQVNVLLGDGIMASVYRCQIEAAYTTGNLESLRRVLDVCLPGTTVVINEADEMATMYEGKNYPRVLKEG